MESIFQLYPNHRPLQTVQGLYLNEKIYTGAPVVYANFVSSLDGRISVKQNNQSYLPERLTNPNDFRLFLELQAHADCLVTHGAYMRARADNRLGDILNIGSHPQHPDLRDWRKQHGLSDAYTLVICSKSLDFPEPDSHSRQNVLIAASEQSPPEKIKQWRDKGYDLIIAGTAMVSGAPLISVLKQRGHRAIFLAAGPRLLTSMLHDGCLDYLYLTISHQFIANRDFHTLIEGISDGLQNCRLQQTSLIYDASPELPYSQWYAGFRCRYDGINHG